MLKSKCWSCRSRKLGYLVYNLSVNLGAARRGDGHASGWPWQLIYTFLAANMYFGRYFVCLQSKCQLRSSIKGVGLASGWPWSPIYLDIRWYHSFLRIYCHISSHRKQYKCHTLEQRCWTCIRVALTANIYAAYDPAAPLQASLHLHTVWTMCPYALHIICTSVPAQIASLRQTKIFSILPRA